MELKLEFVTGQDENGEDIVVVRTFTTGKMKSRLVVAAFEIREEITSAEFKTETLHKLADFACEVYGNKFTRDELYDGLDSYLLISTLKETMEGVISGVTKRQDTFPAVK